MCADTVNEPLLEHIILALRNGNCRAQGIFEQVISRNEVFGERLNAYSQWQPGNALASAIAIDHALAARREPGLFAGIPVSAKDLFGLDGFQTFAGSPTAFPAEWCAEGPVVSALKSAGAAFMGKTNMVEFAFGGIGTNPHWEIPRNPWDRKTFRVSGGSSSGAGVSICEGTAFVALGSDTAGSVRVPASWTGTVGLKTTKNRWSTDGLVPLSTSLDTPGTLKRNVSDAIVAFSVIDPGTTETFDKVLTKMRTRRISGLRIGVCKAMFDGCDPGVAESVAAALILLEKAGAIVTDLEVPAINEAEEIFERGGLAAPEFAALINHTFADWKATLDPNVLARFEKIEAIPAIDYISRRSRLLELASDVDTIFNDVDILVGPTVPITAPTVQEVAVPEEYFRLNMAALRNTSVVNLLDLCALSLPAGRDAFGIPIGFQVIARKNADEELLAISLACESVIGVSKDILGTPPLLA